MKCTGRNRLTANTSDSEIDGVIKDWLRFAKNREGGGRNGNLKRKKSKTMQLKMEMTMTMKVNMNMRMNNCYNCKWSKIRYFFLYLSNFWVNIMLNWLLLLNYLFHILIKCHKLLAEKQLFLKVTDTYLNYLGISLVWYQ